VTAIVERAAYPYRLPPFGEPLRVLFVGTRSRVDASVLRPPSRRIRPALADVRPGADASSLRAAVAAAVPHVVVLLEPHGVPAGALGSTRAATLAFVDEESAPLADDGAPLADALPAAADFDRVVSVTPGASIGGRATWRSLPRPVADDLYAPVRSSGRSPRALVLAEETPYRERMLIRAKHERDVLHYAHGLWGDALRDVLRRVDVGINVHRAGARAFESSALLHLAAGNLLVSEPMSPSHGLEAGIDFVTFESREELLGILFQLSQRPDMYERVRLRGRAKADDYRASRVWPRLVEDLIHDIAAFGTDRRLS
jgi:hypothetical protein